MGNLAVSELSKFGEVHRSHALMRYNECKIPYARKMAPGGFTAIGVCTLDVAK